jgi:23S rRNA (cytosine1962-C5)-methyltransferase
MPTSALAHLWPLFAADRILYEDDEVIVIDKPVNMSTHAPDAQRNDDAVSRLRAAIAERDRVTPASVYLGIHQRLDRDTSGALLFTKDRSVNAAVAAQFEGRKVQKTYLAGVIGWPAQMREGVLAHDLAPGEGGRMRVVSGGGARRAGRPPQPAAGAQSARTRYRVLRRVDNRALLELSPETGRTHQLRVQIAAMGGQIAGDRLYGTAPAARLMLHAVKLSLTHPATGEPLEVSAPAPLEIERWVEGPVAHALPTDPGFEARLATAIEARWALGRSSDTNAFRLVHGEGEGLGGFAVDVYGEHLLVHLFSEEARAQKDAIVAQIDALGCKGVYLKVHPKQSNTLVDPHREELAPAAPVRGDPAPDPLIVWESGLAYRVRLGDGLKTGIFLDQRENRRRVRELAAGKRVLNLFAYTCGFTVAARAGGAAQTVSVDASRGALSWGAENLEQNAFVAPEDRLIDADALVWLKQAKKRGDLFDLVVLDPPSYATTKTSRFSAADDLPELAAQAMSVLAPGGRLLACTNHRGISPTKFRKQMHEAARQSGKTIVQMKDLPEPADFPPPWGEGAHLKSLLITVT